MPPRRFVRKFTLAVWIFGIAAISILGTGQAYAQVAGATLTGTVKDASSGIIPNAQVAITDVATAVTRSVSSGGHVCDSDLSVGNDPAGSVLDCAGQGCSRNLRVRLADAQNTDGRNPEYPHGKRKLSHKSPRWHRNPPESQTDRYIPQPYRLADEGQGSTYETY